MTDLIATLEGLTGPDREADALISKTLLNYADVERDGPAGWKKVPDYTTSLDAAIALVERVLPGELHTVMRPAFMHWHNARLPANYLPRFVLIALLKAKEAADAT